MSTNFLSQELVAIEARFMKENVVYVESMTSQLDD